MFHVEHSIIYTCQAIQTIILMQVPYCSTWNTEKNLLSNFHFRNAKYKNVPRGTVSNLELE